MGFFSDLKEDLSQAVNELLPEDGAEKKEQEDIQTVAEPVTEAEELMELDALLERVDSIEVPEDMDIMKLEAMEEETEQISEPENQPEEDIWPEITEETVTEEVVTDETASVEAEMGIAEEEDADGNDLEASIRAAFGEKDEADKGAEKRMEYQTRTISDETAVITAGMTITGDIASEGSMEVIGTINGNIDIFGKLNITGTILGNSKAAEIYADNAKITGEIVSEGAVKIGQSSVIIGNIIATSAVIAGAVKGDIDVRGPVILDTTAIVMGNIKSKSVQINNGAVIEGMCSQCYAEINPTSFFDDYKKTKNK